MAFIPTPTRFPQNQNEKVEGLLYTKLARFIAFIGILAGVLNVIIGFADESITFISLGLSALLGSIIIGVLTDISLSVAKGRASSSDKVHSSRSAPPTDPEERRKWANREPPYD